MLIWPYQTYWIATTKSSPFSMVTAGTYMSIPTGTLRRGVEVREDQAVDELLRGVSDAAAAVQRAAHAEARPQDAGSEEEG